MHYFFQPHEEHFKEWRRGGYEGIPPEGIVFLEHLRSRRFRPDVKLWNQQQWERIQVEAIERCVYAFEVLGEKDFLTNVVTGGGKTTIIGALIAYLMIVHDQQKFLILAPNTIVRERLVDEFDRHSASFTYNRFPFFFNSHEPLKDRIALHVLRPGETGAGVRSGTIILGNIQQLYTGTSNRRVLMENVDQLCVFNDEAHNTKAELYDELMYALKPKRFFRLDTTATPDRLDGKAPDSKMVFRYGIAEAMRDKVIKRTVVFHPDVKKVRLTYEDLETGKTISAEEVPWEEIERRKISAKRYITSTKPMRQQIAIALELLKDQKRRFAGGEYKPLLFVVAISIRDAERIKQEIEHIGEPYGVRKVLLVSNESDDELKEAARDLNKKPQTEWDAVVSVLMLREGWDVRNISTILLFRKFSFKMVDGQVHSVYGQQVIGRGLRRMTKNPEEWESLYVIDHPILKHAWLWDLMKATTYPDALDPAGIVLDEEKLAPPKEDAMTSVDEGEKTLEEAEQEVLDLSALPPTPEPPEALEPIHEWEKFLDEYRYEMNRMDVEQDIEKIKGWNIDSDLVSSEKSTLPDVSVEQVQHTASNETWDTREFQRRLVQQTHSIARDALVEYDRSVDDRQVVLVKIMRAHFRKRFLQGSEIEDCTDGGALRRLWEVIDQVRDVFTRPELLAGILVGGQVAPKE